jgi:hypothetical protein
MADNCAHVALSRRFLCGSGIRRRYWRQNEAWSFTVLLHYNLCHDTDVSLFELRLKLLVRPTKMRYRQT